MAEPRRDKAVLGPVVGAYSEIEVMSQCSRATSTPKAAIARAPTDPTI